MTHLGVPTKLLTLSALLLIGVPCLAATYTVCAAGPPSCDFTNVQDAVNAASFGDQILLQAGQTFPGFQLIYKPGPAGNPIVITTSAQKYLPAAGTRITPVYAAGTSPVTARIQGSYGSTITTQNGNEGCPASTAPCPAHDYTLIGLEITPGANNSSPYDHVQIGPVSSIENITTASGLPYNITLDRVYVHQDRLAQVRRCVTPHGINITVENSWISDCKMAGVDSQAIENWNGPGPLTIYNNYLDASTEVVALGGALPTIPNLIPGNLTMSYNHVYRPDYYVYTTWAASTWYGQGKFIAPMISNGYQYLAQNSGTTGPTEPVWPTVAGATVTDGTIVWLTQVNDSGTRWLVKNLFETKSSDTINLHHNVFERNPAAAQTGAAILLTVRTSQSGSWAHIFNTTFTNNVIRNSALGFNFLGRDGTDPNSDTVWNPNNDYGTLKYAIISNNLAYDIGNPPWGDTTGPFVALNSAIQNATFDHNTFDFNISDLAVPAGWPGYNITFTNSLLQPGRYGIYGENASMGCPAMNYYFCNNPASPSYPDPNAMCPTGTFNAVVIPNQSISTVSPCTADDVYPLGSYNTPWNSIGFMNLAAGNYALLSTSPYIASGTDGKPLGVDTTQLPLITNLSITPSSNSATFSYTAPNSIACVLRVSTDREFNTVVADVDPTKFLHADSDQYRPNNTGLNRTFVVGANVTQVALDGASYNRALAPNTTYWYWLACGGEGQTATFATTVAPATTTVTVTPSSSTLYAGQSQQFTASAAATWSLSPAVGSISAGGLYTAPASITSQQTVTVTASAGGASASATVTLMPPLTVTPGSSTLYAGQSQQFTASAAATWSLSPAVGSISAGGLYTAPASITSQQTVTVTASAGGTSASATVTLMPPLTVTPVSSTLYAGQSQQFTASAAATWSLSPAVGSISAGGLYTAPASITSQQTVTATASAGGTSARATVTLMPPLPVTPTAAFLVTDTSTQGNWYKAYGSDGFNVIQNTTHYPSYVTVTPSGQSSWVWSSSTSDIQALRKANATDRIAATWFSNSTFTIDLNFADGAPHRVAIYCLDWDKKGRTETVRVVTPDGAVLDSRSVANFAGGTYLVWNLTGHVQIQVICQNGPNAVVSGIFFGAKGRSL